MGFLWAILASSWAILGPSWAVLEAILGLSCPPSGLLWAPMGPLGAIRRKSFKYHIYLKPSCALWGRSWALSGLSWAHLGPSRDPLGSPLGLPGALLGPSWAAFPGLLASIWSPPNPRNPNLFASIWSPPNPRNPSKTLILHCLFKVFASRRSLAFPLQPPPKSQETRGGGQSP